MSAWQSGWMGFRVSTSLGQYRAHWPCRTPVHPNAGGAYVRTWLRILFPLLLLCCRHGSSIQADLSQACTVQCNSEGIHVWRHATQAGSTECGSQGWDCCAVVALCQACCIMPSLLGLGDASTWRPLVVLHSPDSVVLLRAAAMSRVYQWY